MNKSFTYMMYTIMVLIKKNINLNIIIDDFF